MATKTGIIASINGFITAVITQLKLRNGFLELINELYSDAVTDSNSTETYTTKSGTDIPYNVTIKKCGNGSHIKISFRNSTSSSLPALTPIFTWKTNAFKPKVTVNDFPLQGFRGSNSVELFFGDAGLSLSEPLLPISQLYYTSYEFYINQD